VSVGGVGLVGTGEAARLHVAALAQLGVPIAGVVGSSHSRSKLAAEEFGALRAYDSLARMLADPAIGTVHIATPTGGHAGQVRAALEVGKHVVCEKPLATTIAESAELAGLAERTGTVAAVCYTYRYQRAVAAMRERLSDIGVPTLMRVSFLQSWLLDADPEGWRLDPRRNGPSRVVADIGSHVFDLIGHVRGAAITKVSAVFASAATPSERADGDDIALVHLELADGSVVACDLAQVAIGHHNDLRVEITGHEGAIALDIGRPAELRIAGRAGAWQRVQLGHDQSQDPAAPYVEACAALFERVRRAVDGDEVDYPSFRDCHRTNLVRDAVRRSARSGGWVDVVGAGEEPTSSARLADHAVVM
jgi:predicted dehydrogenase